MGQKLSQLRQQLRGKLAEIEAILRPGFEDGAVFPGMVYLARHRCGKSNCRCSTRGELHETLRLQIRFKDTLTNRCISEEGGAFWRPRTEAYKRLRDSERSLRRWHKEVIGLLEAIEHARRSSQGLSEEDRKRPLR